MEQQAEQEVTSLQKRSSSEESQSSNCQEIAAALDLTSASGRLRRESQSQVGQISGQTFVPILAKQTKSI